MAIPTPSSTSTTDPAVITRAESVLASFGRVVGQRIVLDRSGRPRCMLLGVRHRRPVSCTVGLGVARELQRRGVPTVIAAEGARSTAPW